MLETDICTGQAPAGVAHLLSVYYTADWPNLRLKPCHLQAQGKQNWSLPEGFNIQFEGEQAELFIGGVYVRLFLKNPHQGVTPFL